MTREKALHRRYWIAGILCSLLFHGAILFVPLHFDSVRNAGSPSLNIGLIDRAASGSMRGILPAPDSQGKVEAKSPAQGPGKTSQIPDVPPSQPPAEPADVADAQPVQAEGPAASVQSALRALPVPAPLVQEPVEDESLRVSESIASAPDSRQKSLSSGGMPTDAPQEKASSPEPSFAAVPTEEMKEEVSPLGATVSRAAPVAFIAEAGTSAAGSPSADAPMAGTLEAERAQAAPSANAPRQYFASPDGLFAQPRNVTAASSAKTGGTGAGGTVSAQSDSAGAQEASGGAYPSGQIAELTAEKMAYYGSKYNGQGISGASLGQSSQQGAGVSGPAPQAVPGQSRSLGKAGRSAERPSAAPAEENFASSEIAVPPAQSISESSDLRTAKAAPRARGGALQPDAVLMPPAVPAQAGSTGLAGTSSTVEGAARSVAPDQSLPAQPPAKEDRAASVVQPGAPDTEASPVSHFDTVETLLQRIIAELSAQKQYPPAALNRKTEGIVRLALDVAPNGSLVRAKIQAPSGSAILDEAALKLAQSIFPLSVRLTSAVSLVVPIEYRILK